MEVKNKRMKKHKADDSFQMSRSSYIWNHIFWSAWAVFIYSRTIFKTYRMKTFSSSMVILVCIVLAAVFIGGAISWKRNRSGVTVARNIASGLLIYTMLTYSGDGLIISLIILAALLIAVYILLTFKIWKKKTGKITGNFRRCKYRQQLFTGTNVILAVAPMVIFGVTFAAMLIRRIPTDSNVRAYVANDYEKEIEEKLPVLEKLGGFSDMSTQEKLDLAQEIVNLELAYLGLGSRPVPVEAREVDGEGVCIAYYDSKKHDITLDAADLETCSSYDFIVSVCHEVYHSYQEAMVQAYNSVDDEDLKKLKLYEDARIYAEEFETYQDGDDEESFDAYYSQRCEENCRRYGESRADYYFDKLELMGEDPDAWVMYEDQKAYLVNGDGEKVAGPYTFLESSNWSGGGIRRFVDDSGRIGYVDSFGEVISEGYLTGSTMDYGTALVSDEEGFFYIDKKGDPITRKYVQALPFEHNGCYARVKNEEGKWCLINRQDEILYTAEWIDQLPGSLSDRLVSAKKDGHVILLNLTYDEEHRTCTVAKELSDEYDMASVYWDMFVIVRNSDGLYGVLDTDGSEIIPVKYKSIAYDKIRGDEINPTMIQFRLESEDGSIDLRQRIFSRESR